MGQFRNKLPQDLSSDIYHNIEIHNGQNFPTWASKNSTASANIDPDVIVFNSTVFFIILHLVAFV